MTALATTTPFALGIGRAKTLVACASLADASALYRRACDAHVNAGLGGASTMPEGRVYETATMRVVGRVSWNGGIWPGKAWADGDQPLFDPYAGEPKSDWQIRWDAEQAAKRAAKGGVA